jgi:hypothetical protein
MSSDHFLRGLLLSAVLNVLAVGAALAVGLRAKLAGRAELALATIMTWNFLVMCPVYALGFTNRLDARTLALVSAPWFAFVFAIARGATPLLTFGPELGRAALELVRLPFDAVVVTVRARSVVAIGVVFTLAMLVWTFECAYLTPSWKEWDALWYHEPIIGFAIQNHGFAFVDLPTAHAQKINGYPRLCEMTQLWFAIFTDRRVIDMVGHVAPPALALSVYVLARRYTHDAVLAIALGCALILSPACSRLLGSIYVDPHNAAFVLAAAHFATRPGRRLRDAMFATMCLTLAVGSKQMALVPVGILSLVAAARLLRQAPRRPLATAWTILIGVALIGAMTGAIYVRNWLHFGNPFWPDLRYDNDKWGIHWAGIGIQEFEQHVSGSMRFDMNLPLSDLLETLYGVPYSRVQSPYNQMFEYGIGVVWLVVPIAVIACAALCLALVRDLFGLVLRMPEWRASPETRNIAPLVVTLAAMIHFSPALWGPRYQVAAIGLALVLVAWAAGRRGFGVFGREFAGALVTMGIVSYFWMTPRSWLWWSEAISYAKIPFPAREVTPAAEISPTLPIWNGSPVTKAAGLARENELAPGAVFAFPSNYGSYMALFWNNEFSNRVVYVPEFEDFLGQVTKSKALWTYCAAGDPLCRVLTAPNSGWAPVGVLDVESHGIAFRRTRQ